MPNVPTPPRPGRVTVNMMRPAVTVRVSPSIVAINGDDLPTHLADTTPHPAYDDMPSLALLFENGLI